MTEPLVLVSRISVTYVKVSPGGQRETHIIGLTSNRNKKHIDPGLLCEMLRAVALCCEDVIAERLISAGNHGCGESAGNHEVDDGQRTVTTTESVSASHE